jgi:alpha-glucosidase
MIIGKLTGRRLIAFIGIALSSSLFSNGWASSNGRMQCAPTKTENQNLRIASSAVGRMGAAPSTDPWWQHAVFYEIYPRSFADAKNSGMGNINGITEKLDYLKDLGIDAIWITPCYPSPQVDFGYDISDYRDIAPEYGTLADFDRLVAEAKKRDIRIVMDLVLNHTSDKHAWFTESASSKTNPKRDWYVWRDGKSDGGPPNNWQSVFGHSAWKLDPRTNQYYYHLFYPEQPDLNWRNPEVRKAMYDTARFWLDRGVAGFRLDAILTLFEDPKLTDNPILPGKNSYGDPNMDNKYNDRLPEVHDVLRELRNVIDSYADNRVLIGETGGRDVAQVSAMYGKHLDEIQLPMNFFFADVNKLSAADFRKRIAEWDKNPAGGWPVYLFSNHDQVRHYVRYGDGQHNDDIAKLTATMLLTLRGSPILYYGEEIGMENNDPKAKEDVQDPIGKIGWPKEKGRDGERTPMQWNGETNAGFSDAKTWLPVTAEYKSHNVAAERNDPSSILSFYKQLIALRRSQEPLIHGSYITLNPQDNKVLSYLRKGKDNSVLVALNMTSEPQQVSFNLKPHGVKGTQPKTLISSPAGATATDLQQIALAPFGVYVAELPND